MDHKKFGDAVLALDVGAKRIGVAVAAPVARLARPLTTLTADESVWQELEALCQREAVGTVVVGLPRGLDGQETAQTAYCRDFADQVRQRLGLPVQLQDEALTSQAAEAELTARGRTYARGDIDALAATLILEDYLQDNPSTTH